MKSIFKILLIGCIHLLYTSLFAQNTITGKVVDQNNHALINVEIYAPEVHKGTVTNEQGEFLLQNIPAGTVKLSITSLGYESQLLTVNTKEQATLNIQLKSQIFAIDEVILSTLFNKLQGENVMKVDYQLMNTLQQNGGSTLMENLATLPGVSQLTTGNAIGKPVIRGLSGNRVVVYANGVRIENQQFGDEHGLGLNEAGFESVEVIKGPASLLYGSDAIAGVLYFTPEKFAQTGMSKADFSTKYYSNTQGSNSSLGYKSSTENWKFLVRGTYNSHLDYKTPSEGRIHNSRFNEKDLKSGIGYNNSKFSSNLRYTYTETNLGIPEDYEVQSSRRSPDFPSQLITQHLISSHNHVYLDKGKIEANLGYQLNDRNELEAAEEIALAMKLTTFNYDIKYYLPERGKLESIIGLQGMHQNNHNYGEELLIPDANINDIGFFATFNYTLPKISYQAGLRADHRSINSQEHGISGEEGYVMGLKKSFNNINASFGLKTNPFKNTVFRANLASGFRAPNLAELTSNGVHEGSNRYEIGNPFLKNEQNFQTDISFEYETDHFEFFVNGFYNYITNYIFLQPSGEVIDETDVFAYVQGDSKLYGGEVGIHLHPHPLDWLHFESTFESVYGKQNNGDYLPLIPANQWNNTLKITYNSSKWLKNSYTALQSSSTYSQNRISAFETPSQQYVLFHLNSGGTVQLNKTLFELSFNIQNVGNKTYVPHLSRLKSDAIPAMGRNFVVGLKFKL